MLRETVLTFGPFRLDAGTESLWRDGEEIRLRPKAFAVLRFLAERPGRLVTKPALLESVWPEVTVDDAALAVCVNEIRRALNDEARTPRFVETVHRRGYRFVAPVGHGGPVGPGRDAAGAPVGRQAELGELHARLERARRGERQVVFVTGEAGIGKTTLVERLLADLDAEACWIGRGQCLDHYGAGEAYLPVLEALGRLARGAGGERIPDVLARLAPTWLAQLPALVPPEETTAPPAGLVHATRERMLREMAEALEALAADRLLVLALEDLHWSDPSTLDLIAGVARRREPARLLLVGTYRPLDVIVRGHPLRAVAHELRLHGACVELPLQALGETDVERYLSARFGGRAAAQLAPAVYHRTEGLPLFVVNVVDTLVRERVLVEAAGGWEVKPGQADVETAVPDSLRQMIEQQLAALPADEQRLLEAASVAGMTFSAAAPAAALGEAVEAIEDRCEALARREQFLRAAGVEEWPDCTVAAGYRFRHVFYQQILYERLSPARRAGLHGRIAEREEAGFQARVAERAAALAVHFERAREPARAIRYRRLAAEHALERCAYPEAIEHLRRAHETLEALPAAAGRDDLELEIQMTLGPALIALRGPGPPEIEAVYRRARELAERLGDAARLYRALWGLWFVSYGHGDFRAARDMGERLLALADAGGEPEPILEAHHTLWATLHATGETTAALGHVERGLALYDPARHRAHARLYGGHDTGVCCWNHRALGRWLIGHPDRAVEAAEEALRLAGRRAHPLTTVIAHDTAARIHYFRGELVLARARAERAVAVNTLETWLDAAVVLACVETREGGPTARVTELCRQLATVGTQGLTWRNMICFCLLAEVAYEAGDVDAGEDALARIPVEHRGAAFAAEIERVRGELLLHRSRRGEAERCFRRAIATAQARGERALELRAATSLARLLARTRRAAEARSVLGPVHATFTEGLQTADVRAARALLTDLGSEPAC